MTKAIEEKTVELIQMLNQRVVQQQTLGNDCSKDSEVLQRLLSYRETVLIPALKETAPRTQS